ncbi:MAG: hypothetical protein KDA51_09915 [Planctomycetales bacterium]|nr:hypothetical protein [Planctomycetales bacterium]
MTFKKCLGLALGVWFGTSSVVHAELRVGAAKVDVSPDQWPVLVNGGMTSHSADKIKTRVNARAIVLDDGGERLAIMVVDSCMMPRTLLDEAKQLASTRTQLRPDRILISATHSHTAPSSFGCLGTDADANYVPLLRQRLVEALVAAERNLTSARVGWGSGQAPQFTALRRWVRRPDRIALDPFGNPTVRANMHSAANPDDATGPTGPEDPELCIIAFETLDGQPIAALANFSMHYFSDSPISADYFGLFCDGMERFMGGAEHQADASSTTAEDATDEARANATRERKTDGRPVPVAIMSHGCSGDIWKKDYLRLAPEAEGTIEEYTQGLLAIATEVYERIETKVDADLAMQQAVLPMHYRTPDAQRLQWSQQIVAETGDRLPQTLPEIYAREQVFLNQYQSTEIVVQAIRIGDMAIASTPTETYALSGLKLKLQSPLPKTMVIELANGAEGYIPPPEQHLLGGYNTWAARSAGLETTAEPRIVAADLRLLEQVSGLPRREFEQSLGPAAETIAELKPLAYWRMEEMSGSTALDRSGAGRNAVYEAGVLFFLEGPTTENEPAALGAWTPFTTPGETNRCAHFAGGRMLAEMPELHGDYSVVLSFWNGMPLQAREVAGWMFSRDYDFSHTDGGVHLGLSGGTDQPGRLVLQAGNGEPHLGRTATPRWQWGRAVLVKLGNKMEVYQADAQRAEISIELNEKQAAAPAIAELFFGGRSDRVDNWEGKLDEIAVFDRGLSQAEVAQLLK